MLSKFAISYLISYDHCKSVRIHILAFTLNTVNIFHPRWLEFSYSLYLSHTNQALVQFRSLCRSSLPSSLSTSTEMCTIPLCCSHYHKTGADGYVVVEGSNHKSDIYNIFQTAVGKTTGQLRCFPTQILLADLTH